MSIKDDKTTYLVGDFSGAHVFVGGLIQKKVDSDDLLKPFHDVEHGGHTYRFINANEISESSVETLKQRPNAFIFGGDMRDVMLSVSKKSINAMHMPELDL